MIRIALKFPVKMDRPHTLSKWIGITLVYNAVHEYYLYCNNVTYISGKAC